MRLSEWIQKLSALKEQHGDIDAVINVVTHDDKAWHNCYYDGERIEFKKDYIDECGELPQYYFIAMTLKYN